MALKFDFRVVFTGICTLVPHTDGKSMVALMADGRDSENPTKPKIAQDGGTLKRHVGFLRFPLSVLGGAAAGLENGSGIWYPNGDRISIVPQGANDFSLGTLPHTARLEEFAGHLAGVDPKALKVQDPSAGSPILAQVVIRHGEVSESTPSSTRWSFNGNLGKPQKTLHLAHRVIVDMGKVESVAISATPLASGPGPSSPSPLLQISDRSDPVDLEVFNLCDDNPLGWPGTPLTSDDDVDFRWHYQLVKQRDEIEAALQTPTQPNALPHPVKTSLLPPAPGPVIPGVTAAKLARDYSPGGDNCYGTLLPAYDYDADPLS